jgi:hypothetical protein
MEAGPEIYFSCGAIDHAKNPAIFDSRFKS